MTVLMGIGIVIVAFFSATALACGWHAGQVLGAEWFGALKTTRDEKTTVHFPAELSIRIVKDS